VTGDILGLVLANVLMLGVGIGLLPLLRLARTWRELALRLPLAYAVGLAGTGIAASELALLDVSVGVVALPILTAASLAAGLRRLGHGTAAARRARFSPLVLPAYAVLAVALVYLANAARLFSVKPLLENDGWALWGLRAQALYDFGHPVAPIFTKEPYPGLQYPLLLPSLEAIGARFMGTYDGTLLHLQLLGFGIAFVGGAWTLLRGHAPSLLLASALLAVVTAPSFFGQLQTASADVPLAMTIALGVTALAAWVRTGQQGLLPTATLFLAAGAMVKNEGELFALAAFVAAFAVTRRPQLRPLVRAALAWVALVLPWHVWLWAHGVTSTTFALSHLLDPSYLTTHWYRVESAQRQLLHQLWLDSSWSRLPLLAIAGFAGALVLRRFRLVMFGAGWLVLSFAGLLCVYWASPLPLENNLYNSADRTIDTLVIGGAMLVPVLLALERDPAIAAPSERAV
jgi:hypothetical protein